MNKYCFQYCQKIVVFSKNNDEVLLCKRKGENDYDDVFSFIGGKMERGDKSIIDSIKREKDEEVGKAFKMKIYPNYSSNVLFMKKDGSAMILPPYYGVYVGGPITLSEEYSEYKWVKISQLQKFEPRIPTIPSIVKKLLRLIKIADEKDFVEI